MQLWQMRFVASVSLSGPSYVGVGGGLLHIKMLEDRAGAVQQLDFRENFTTLSLYFFVFASQ